MVVGRKLRSGGGNVASGGWWQRIPTSPQYDLVLGLLVPQGS